MTEKQETLPNPANEAALSERWAVGLVFGAAFLVALATLGDGWIRDDYMHLARLRDGGPFMDSGWDFYRPVFSLVFWISVKLGQGLPLVPRLASAVILGFSGFLTIRLGERFGLSSRAALFAALLVIVHPLAYETSVWVCAMSGPLGECFALAAMLTVLGRDRMPHRGRIAASTGLLLLGFLTKESILPYFFLIPWMLLLAHWKKGSGVLREGLRLWPYLLSGLLLVLHSLGRAGNSSLNQTGSIHLDFLHAAKTWLEYEVSLLVPFVQPGLIPKISPETALPFWIGLAVFSAFLGWIAWKERNRRSVQWLGWMAVAPLPYVFFDWGVISRYAFAPSIPAMLLLATLYARGERFFGEKRLWIPALPAFLLLSLGAYDRWESPAVWGWKYEGMLERMVENNLRSVDHEMIDTVFVVGLPIRLGWGDTGEQVRRIAHYLHAGWRPEVPSRLPPDWKPDSRSLILAYDAGRMTRIPPPNAP